jgi:hypothetical protein
MKMRKLFLLAGTLSVLSATSALPAGAATPTTFEVTAGALSISAPTASVSLGTQVASNSSSTITGPLGVVTVSDLRGGSTTWVSSVISTSFTPTPTGTANPASNVSYAAGTITESANLVATGVAAPNLTGVSPVVNGTSSGVSTGSWNPTISVFVPANSAPGIYSATITHSVA